MTAAQLDQEREAQAEEVLGWRLEQLLRAGYHRHDARQLARRFDVDLHQAIDLLDKGCPPAVAVSILQ